MWKYVIPHFEEFLGELELSLLDRNTADGKADRVAKSLAAKYYPNQDFNPNWYLKVGSYGKGVAAKPRTDLDMLFILPWHVYPRIEGLFGNRQSQLLQEVKRALQITFPRTDLRGDGQVVIAPFDTYDVEVVPAFRFEDGSFITAHTADGGSWLISNPLAEYQVISATDSISAGKATHLIKMLKAWKREWNVEIKSISLEVLATAFVSQWEYRQQTLYYYDWLMRDFFAFMLQYVNGRTQVRGTQEWIDLGDCWRAKCQKAYAQALQACQYERTDEDISATFEWQRVFATQFKVNYLRGLLVGA